MSKTILITGCSDGSLGSALALQFLKRGLKVFATARNPSKMSDLTEATCLTLDASSPATIKTAVAEVEKITGGTLDYLICAHGSFLVTPLLDLDIDTLRVQFENNVFGMLQVVQGFAPLLIKAKGTLVNIGSMAAYFHAPFLSPYGAPKAAHAVFTETLRLELEPLGVKVLLVEGGAVHTNLFKPNANFHLPDNSLYKVVEDKVTMYAKGEDIPDKMPLETFAANVTSDILGGAKNKIYRGKMATQLKYVRSLPESVIEGGMMKASGLVNYHNLVKQK